MKEADSDNNRKSFFTECVIHLWNSLLLNVLMPDSSGLGALKGGLDKLIDMRVITGL